MRDYSHATETNSTMKPLHAAAILVGVGIIIAVLVLYFFWRQPDNDIVSQPLVIERPTTPTEPEQEVAAPVLPEPDVAVTESTPTAIPKPAPEPVQEPLPSLYNSDEAVLAELGELSSDARLLKMVVPESIIQRFVRVVIAMSEGDVVHDYRPITSPQSELQVIQIEEILDPDIGQRYRLASSNYERYEDWVAVFEKIDKALLATLYRRYYPLVQEAYGQHGAKIKEFDTVLASVMQEALEISHVEKNPILVRRNVFFQFYDTELENKSDLEKLFIRIGPDNTRRLQNALREFQQELNKP